MTKAYLRTKRGGKWKSIEIDQLTDKELDQLEKQDPEKGWFWAKFLAKWIRDNVREEDYGRRYISEP